MLAQTASEEKVYTNKMLHIKTGTTSKVMTKQHVQTTKIWRIYNHLHAMVLPFVKAKEPWSSGPNTFHGVISHAGGKEIDAAKVNCFETWTLYCNSTK